MKSKQNEQPKLITYLNYKDILIILGFWFLITAIISITRQLELQHILLTNIFQYLFIVFGRFLYIALIVFYLTSLYPITFKQLGIKFTPFRDQLITGFSRVLVLIATILLLVNIRLGFKEDVIFTPLYVIKGPEHFMAALPPFLLMFSGNMLLVFSEQFILNIIVYELFKSTLFNRLFATILSALFYSIIIVNLEPGRMLVSFIAALISLLLYQKKNSLLPSTIFMAGYYSVMIFFVYGWEFIIY